MEFDGAKMEKLSASWCCFMPNDRFTTSLVVVEK
jgi:hypothetical protein